MTNRKGGRFEKELLDYFRSVGYDAERLRLTGTQDEGDLRIFKKVGNFNVPIVLEAKNTARMDLAGWITEAEVERDHYVQHRPGIYYAHFAVVHKRRGKGPGGAYVTLPLNEYLEQLR